jgi:hypothetical protein
VVLSIANALLAMIIITVRVSSVVTHGAWAETTGFEGVGLNVIAYAQHHWPPYRDLGAHATTAIFNVGFYGTYAAAARAVDGDGFRVLLSLRLMTLGTVIAGALVLGAWMDRRVPSTVGEGARRIVAFSMAIWTLLGSFTGWWAITARPDATAMVFETIGLIAAVEVARGHWRHGAVAAAILFGCALAFKQTEIAAFATVLVAWLIGGQRRPVAVGTAVLVIVVGAGVLLGGPYYAANIIGAAAAAEYSIANGLRETAVAAVTGFPVFAPAVLIAMRGTTRRDPALPAYLMFFGCGAIGLVELTRLGANHNYLFPSYVAGIVIIVTHLSKADAWTPPALRLMCATLAASVILMSLYLILPDTFGRITFGSVDVQSARAVRLAIERAPEPIFIENEFDAVPWHSGHPDTESVDWIIYRSAVRRGIIKRSIESRIAAREYASVFSTGIFRSTLKEAGYQPITAFPNGTLQYAQPAAK